MGGLQVSAANSSCSETPGLTASRTGEFVETRLLTSGPRASKRKNRFANA
jgi:hypothetical protein